MRDKYIVVNGKVKKVHIEGNLIKIEGSIVDIPISDLALIGIETLGLIYQEDEHSEELILKEGIEVIKELLMEGLSGNSEK